MAARTVIRGALLTRSRLTYVREMTERDQSARRAAIAILKLGIMTVPEVAAYAGVSRQLVRYWCKRANVSFAKIRSERIAKVWASEVRG